MQNNSAQVRPEGGRRVTRKIEHFNLDVIISVGYRVKSLRGTQFRQWATRRLREHLVSGYTLNRQRLAERGLREARDTLDLLARTFAAIADFRAALIARGEASPLFTLGSYSRQHGRRYEVVHPYEWLTCFGGPPRFLGEHGCEVELT